MDEPKFDALAVLKEILRTDTLRELKEKRKEFFYRFQDELVLRADMAGRPNREMLERYLKDPHIAILEILPPIQGWRY